MQSDNQVPIQGQPQRQSDAAITHHTQLYGPCAVVPPGLECLVEEEDVILKKRVFQNKNGQILFHIYDSSECCGPSFQLWLRDLYQRDVVSFCLESPDCCGETYLTVCSPPSFPIGFITIISSSNKLKVSIQTQNREQIFSAKVPISLKNIEIFGPDGLHPVARITKEKKKKVMVFSFPVDMAATLKTLILGAFLYMRFKVEQMTSDNDGLSTSTSPFPSDPFGPGCPNMNDHNIMCAQH